MCVITRMWKNLHDRIYSLRGEVKVHKTSLTPPLFIEVHVPSQGREPSCIWVLGVSISSFSTIFLLDFGPALTVLFFILLQEPFLYSDVISVEQFRICNYNIIVQAICIPITDDSSVHIHNISNKFKRLVIFVYC